MSQPNIPHSDAAESTEGFLSSFPPVIRQTISNLPPAAYQSIISEKTPGAAPVAFLSDSKVVSEALLVLQKLSVPELERLKKSVELVMQADATARSEQSPAFPEAARLYQSAAEQNPFNDLALMSCGTALARSGRLKEGIGWIEKALEVNPGNKRALSNLETIKQDLQRAQDFQQVFLLKLAIVGFVIVLLALAVNLAARTQLKARESVIPVDPRGLAMLQLSLPAEQASTPVARTLVLRALKDRMAGIPGLPPFSLSNNLTLSDPPLRVKIGGEPGVLTTDADLSAISPEFFTVMRIALRAGRLFADSDALSSAGAAIIDEALARKQWPGQNPLGKRIEISDTPGSWEIVGVVGNLQHSLTEPTRPHVYLPLAQFPASTPELRFILRTPDAKEALRETAEALSGQISVIGRINLEEQLSVRLRLPRFIVLLSNGLTAAGLLLLLGSIILRMIRRSQFMRSLPDGMVCCPACGHLFEPPQVLLTTSAVMAQYGPGATLCPNCKHKWSRKVAGKIKLIDARD